MSLPHKLGATIESIPADVPYLEASPKLAAVWGERVAAMVPGLRVGLAWSGNPQHANDWVRSIPFEKFHAIVDTTGVGAVGIQKDLRASDAASFAASGVADVRAFLTDFSETAALISQLDLVITVDTALAHLANALGKPVWVLLSAISDWRWLDGRDDSPWYPTARLFRQRSLGDWTAVLADVTSELAALVARKRSSQ